MVLKGLKSLHSLHGVHEVCMDLPLDVRYSPRRARRVSRAAEAAWPALSTAPAVLRRACSERDVHAVTVARAVTEARAPWPKHARQ